MKVHDDFGKCYMIYAKKEQVPILSSAIIIPFINIAYVNKPTLQAAVYVHCTLCKMHLALLMSVGPNAHQ